jgi:hypothetical protein
MGLAERFWNWLRTSTRSAPKKGHPDLYPIDVAKLTKELRLAEEGERLGKAGLPPADAKTLSGPEAAIVQRVEKARQDYVDWAVRRLTVLSQDLGKRNVTQAVNRARQADKEFERKASGALSELEGLLRTLGDTAKRLKGELETFRTTHDIAREPNFPSSSGVYFRYAILLLLILIEGTINAGFFAYGLSTGLIGGFATAGVLAAFNVIVAFAFGKFFVCYWYHTRIGQKVMGLIGFFAAVAVMTGVGLGIAHYRDSLTAEAADAAKTALQTLRASPFELRDAFSWALFGISIAFGLAALFDGLYSDDPYPGYGAIARRAQQAIDDHEDELATMRATLEELKNDELKVLDRTLQESQAAVAVFQSLIEDKKAAGSRLSTALRDADNSLAALLSRFRTENELHRGDVPRPKHFDSKPQLLALQLPDFDTTADEAALKQQSELVESLLAEAQQVRARIQESFNQQFDRLKPLDSHFPRKGEA